MRHFISPNVLAPFVQRAFEEVGQRCDANETMLVAEALTQTAVKTLRTIYPGTMARMLAPVVPNIDPGIKKFTYHRVDVEGVAKIVVNFGDDLPRVDGNVTEMEGKVRTLADSFAFTTEDIRRLAFARRSGRMSTEAVIDVNKMDLANEMIERKKDTIFAQGDTTWGLPGMLQNADIGTYDAAAAAGGSNARPWDGADKTATEILTDLRAAASVIFEDSKGRYRPNKAVFPIAQYRVIASRPIATNSDTRTILQAFLDGERAAGSPDIQVYAWNECYLADGGSNDRGLMGYFAPETIGLIDPMAMQARSPQEKNLETLVPCEAKCGGCVVFAPLAFQYIDQI